MFIILEKWKIKMFTGNSKLKKTKTSQLADFKKSQTECLEIENAIIELNTQWLSFIAD